MSELIPTLSSEGSYKESGSVFTCFLLPISILEDFQNSLSAVKLEHPKASHHCYAYRIKNGADIIEFSSDAGEPSGSAGLPILNTLKSNEIINVSAVVIRYYGGSKLGIPGLIHAYKTATIEALSSNKLIEYVEMSNFKLTASFEDVGLAYRLLNSTNVNILEYHVTLKNSWLLSLPTNQEAFLISEAEKYHVLTLEKI